MSDTPTRWLGLDVHKHYLIALGVDADLKTVFGPQRIEITQLEEWAKKRLTKQDAVVLEMTTNTWDIHDLLKPLVHSVTVVHPPHVALIVRAQVKTDQKAALALATLHAKGLLPGIWVPPQEVRDLRALVAQRQKMVRLKVQAKCRLHSMLHRHRVVPPAVPIFDPDMRAWWLLLPVSTLEKMQIECDLDTLAFANAQLKKLEGCLGEHAAKDERVPLLIQLPGVGMVGAMTILAAVGDITRFADPGKLVGYAGLGARVHASGQTYTTGRITKSGRRDLRRAMVEAANAAAKTHPHWKQELARLQYRLGRSKAIVAIARKLLVAVWHVLTHEVADRHADAPSVAASFFALAYKVRVANLPDGVSATAFTRQQLDRLGIGAELDHVRWGTKRPKLPASSLTTPVPEATMTAEG